MKTKKILSFILSAAIMLSFLPAFTPNVMAGVDVGKDESDNVVVPNIPGGIIADIDIDTDPDDSGDTGTEIIEKKIMLGTSMLSGYDNGYDYIYYGTYNSEPVKWRILDTAYKYNKADSSKTSMLLLSENTLGITKFGSSAVWNGSMAQTWCSDIYIRFRHQ